MVWVQCFNVMVAVLSEQYPHYIQHFLAYQSHIVREYKKSLEWVAYNMAYRSKATLGSHRPKSVSNVAQWLRRASIVHALPKQKSFGSTLSALWG